MTLSEQDNGSAIELNPDDTLTLTLKENRSTGYSWAMESDGGLKLISDDFEGGAAMGSPGVRRLVFTAAKSGSSQLRLKYWQEFAGDQSTADRFELTIAIR